MALGENIKREREKLGWSTYQLAEESGVKQSSIWRIEAGHTRPRPETLVKLASALKRTVPQLDYGLGESDILPVGTRRIPVLDYVQAGLWAGVAPSFRDEEMQDVVLTNEEYSTDAFAMRVRGDSMLPLLREGDVIMIEPGVAPHPGDIVVAVEEGGQATVKQYKSVGVNAFGQEVFELRPFNDMFPTMRSDIQAIRIIGTVMSFQHKFRAAKKH